MDEDAALAELCVLTGLEPSSARHMLAAAGNVELAASLYFDGSPGAVSDASEGAIFQIDDLEAPSIEEASVRQNVPQHGRAGRGRRRRGRGSACEWDGEGLDPLDLFAETDETLLIDSSRTAGGRRRRAQYVHVDITMQRQICRCMVISTCTYCARRRRPPAVRLLSISSVSSVSAKRSSGSRPSPSHSQALPRPRRRRPRPARPCCGTFWRTLASSIEGASKSSI